MKKLFALAATLLTGCVSIPDGIEPVEPFDLERYLGRWYEIARLDHSFERGLSQVSAEYSLRENGTVRVVNRGYSKAEKKWKEAEGKARFVRSPKEGFLKVSFFGPFYASYIIFALDQDHYNYAMISGPDTSYLWILSRKPTLEQKPLDKLIEKARQAGFDTGNLIFVEHAAD
ncbi:MAG: lipocalin family protein [Desulfuromonadaceae bacterium]